MLNDFPLLNPVLVAGPRDLMSTLAAYLIIPITLLVAFGQPRIIEGLTAGANI